MYTAKILTVLVVELEDVSLSFFFSKIVLFFSLSSDNNKSQKCCAGKKVCAKLWSDLFVNPLNDSIVSTNFVIGVLFVSFTGLLGLKVYKNTYGSSYNYEQLV